MTIICCYGVRYAHGLKNRINPELLKFATLAGRNNGSEGDVIVDSITVMRGTSCQIYEAIVMLNKFANFAKVIVD